MERTADSYSRRGSRRVRMKSVMACWVCSRMSWEMNGMIWLPMVL